MIRRDVTPEEMSLFMQLCASVSDLTARRVQLLAAVQGADTETRTQAQLVRPRNVREVIELVKLGIVDPADARLIVDIPASVRPIGFWARLRDRLTSVGRYARMAASGPATD